MDAPHPAMAEDTEWSIWISHQAAQVVHGSKAEAGTLGQCSLSLPVQCQCRMKWAS